MGQVFPHHDNFVEGLEITLAPKNGEIDRKHTSLTFCGPPSGYVLTRWIRTFEPSKLPSYTHPEAGERLILRRESESLHDFGSISLTPHISRSSRKYSRNAELA